MKFLKKIQFVRNLIYYFYFLYPFKTKIFNNRVSSVVVETTNVCNLKCPVCPSHLVISRKKGFMQFSVFKRLIDSLVMLKKRPLIVMNYSGEPLLNKEITAFCQYATANKFKTFISTNATLLNATLSKNLILSGLTDIHLCIDGFSAEAHEAYRIGSNFYKVKKNIETFMKIKKKLGRKTPRVTIQTLLTSLSESHLDELISWAKSIGADYINFKTLSLGSSNKDSTIKKYKWLLPHNKKFLRKQTLIRNRICKVSMDQVVVYWNGDIGLCCIDFNNKIKVGSLYEDNFIKILNSKKFRNIRVGGLLKKYEICKKCSLGNADNMGEIINLK